MNQTLEQELEQELLNKRGDEVWRDLGKDLCCS